MAIIEAIMNRLGYVKLDAYRELLLQRASTGGDALPNLDLPASPPPAPRPVRVARGSVPPIPERAESPTPGGLSAIAAGATPSPVAARADEPTDADDDLWATALSRARAAAEGAPVAAAPARGDEGAPVAAAPARGDGTAPRAAAAPDEPTPDADWDAVIARARAAAAELDAAGARLGDARTRDPWAAELAHADDPWQAALARARAMTTPADCAPGRRDEPLGDDRREVARAQVRPAHAAGGEPDPAAMGGDEWATALSRARARPSTSQPLGRDDDTPYVAPRRRRPVAAAGSSPALRRTAGSPRGGR
jgi:hypothetical protein